MPIRYALRRCVLVVCALGFPFTQAAAELSVPELLDAAGLSFANQISCGTALEISVSPKPLPDVVGRTYSADVSCKRFLQSLYVSPTRPVAEICEALIHSGYGLGSIAALALESQSACNRQVERSASLVQCESPRPQHCSADECDRSLRGRRSCRVSVSPENLQPLDTSTMHGAANSCQVNCSFRLSDYERSPGGLTVACSGCAEEPVALE